MPWTLELKSGVGISSFPHLVQAQGKGLQFTLYLYLSQQAAFKTRCNCGRQGKHETNLTVHFSFVRMYRIYSGEERERQLYCSVLGDGTLEITMLKCNLQIASFTEKVILEGLVQGP